ncbi:hypothetical protein ABNP32_03415 [Pseudomonas viridiflava]|jgi:hypothetical protein|uniref:hypothetical protein n=1 Tax=Pseudomonas sp. TaxID=306 RepID=UPI0031D98338
MAEQYAGQIVAVGPDNLDYQIQVFQDVITERLLSGEIRHTPGLKRFQLQGGGAVNRLSETEYLVVATDMKLTVYT